MAARLQRLQDAAVVRGIHAEPNAAAQGFGLPAIIGITVARPAQAQLLAVLAELPERLECHHVSGADSSVLSSLIPRCCLRPA